LINDQNEQQIFIVSLEKTISRSRWAPIVEARIEPSTFWPVVQRNYQLSYPARLGLYSKFAIHFNPQWAFKWLRYLFIYLSTFI
jgi:hypothetical protein